MPGKYTIKLTANGKTFSQILNVRIDPRVTTSTADLQQQFTLSMQAYEGIKQTFAILEEVKKLQATIKSKNDKDLEAKLNLLLNGKGGNAPTPVAEFALNRLNGAFGTLLDLLQDADVAPTTQAVATAKDLQIALATAVKNWNEIKGEADKKGYK
jgi:hypothetical protein